MTNQHQATPDEWAQQEDWANRSAFSDSSCIIELRDRVEALEATQQPRAFTGQVVAPITNQTGPGVGVALYLDPSEEQHGVTSDRLIARDTPAPGSVPFSVAPPNCRERLLRDGKPYPKSSCEACGSLSPMWRQCNAALMALEPTTQPRASLLVERIKHRLIKGIGGNWEEASCDVIREVAAWLKEEGYSTLQAEALAQEANR